MFWNFELFGGKASNLCLVRLFFNVLSAFELLKLPVV